MRTFRFAVGDSVQCCIDSADGQRRAEGVVVRRCYREDEWPRGYYAAYQVRLAEGEVDQNACLIYAPRDEDCFIRRSGEKPTKDDVYRALGSMLQVSRRLSRERRLLRTLEENLNGADRDDPKKALCDKLRKRHKEAMRPIIADVSREFACSVL